MSHYPPSVAIVNGYGTNLDEDYKQHLDAVIERADEFDLIILSGGFTSREHPALSEAHVMEKYIATHFISIGRRIPDIIGEELALTTRQNLFYSKEIIERLCEKYGASPDITVFCKRPWWLKVRLLSLIILSPRWKVNVQGTVGATSRKEYVKQWCIGTPYDVLSVFIPWLERKKLKRRGLRL